MDAAKESLQGFWIGAPRQPSSRYQEIAYETLPAFCVSCHMQGHNKKNCKRNLVKNKGYDGKGEDEKEALVRKKNSSTEPILDVSGN